jgi:hypothetical protein
MAEGLLGHPEDNNQPNINDDLMSKAKIKVEHGVPGELHADRKTWNINLVQYGCNGLVFLLCRP